MSNTKLTSKISRYIINDDFLSYDDFENDRFSLENSEDDFLVVHYAEFNRQLEVSGMMESKHLFGYFIDNNKKKIAVNSISRQSIKSSTRFS